mmetsp:Transcript_21834/g.24375  ORF Transcript_21834/g.24375 Transcript_21834/m.24375 type:complete len:128 (-) Transcript_21834:95-478(-)
MNGSGGLNNDLQNSGPRRSTRNPRSKYTNYSDMQEGLANNGQFLNEDSPNGDIRTSGRLANAKHITQIQNSSTSLLPSDIVVQSVRRLIQEDKNITFTQVLRSLEAQFSQRLEEKKPWIQDVYWALS